MATAMPEFTDYKSYYHRFDDCVKVIARRQVYTVFIWLYDGGGKYVGKYFQEKGGSLNIIQDKDDRKQLRDETLKVEDMDIPLLYKMMLFTCGLSPANDNIWQNPEDSDKDSIEYSLHLLRGHRNVLSHKDCKIRKLSDAEITIKIDEVRNLCQNILLKAGEKLGKRQEAAERITEMEHDLKKIIGYQSQDISTLGKIEISKKVTNCFAFCPELNLQHKGNILHLNDLFGTIDKAQGSSVIFVKGDAGMGKSALCQYLEGQWSKEDKSSHELCDYKLLLLIRCREVCTRDVICLLRQDLLPDTMKYCDPYKIPELLQDLEVLWIMDGLEEATKEATDLIKKLTGKRNPKHTFIIASRHEYIYSITKDLKTQYSEVTLEGVNPLKYFAWLKNSQNGIVQSISEIDDSIKYFKKLKNEVKAELHNPLKLQIALQFWRDCGEDFQVHGNLTRLYEKLEDSQKKSLVCKLTTGSMTEVDMVRKVEKWFDYLCEISFDMTSNKEIVQISKETLRKLKEKCDMLQIPSSDCISSFLANSGSGEYHFYHSTQQYYLAALHVSSSYKSTNSIQEAMKIPSLSSVDRNDGSLLHFYDVLLHLIGVMISKNIKFIVKNFVEVLSKAIDNENASPKWFEVIQISNYNKQFLKCIGVAMPDVWYITDQNLEPANQVMKYKMPSRVIIQLASDPKWLEINPILHHVSKCKNTIYIDLYLNYHVLVLNVKDTSNDFLNSICKEDVNCKVVGFAGHLDLEGYKSFGSENIRSHCTGLQLRVTSVKCLTSFSYHVSRFKAIADVELLFIFVNYKNFSIPAPIRNCRLGIILLNILDHQVENAAKLISKLSLDYKAIVVNKLSQKGALAFVKSLEKKNVRSGAFMRDIHIPQKGIHRIDFGPLPLQFPINHFSGLWVHSEQQTH